MNIAIILSGCGNRDGSELQETLSLFLAVDRRGWNYQCFAPEGFFEVEKYTEADVDDDLEEGSLVDVEQRDIFEESARVARGNIKPLGEYHAEDYDALMLPGGLGAARNLSTYTYEGPNMVVVDEVHDAILNTYRAKKPVCAMCIAPVVLAKVLGRYGITLTFGEPCQASAVAEQLGCKHQCCPPTEACIDSEHKIITTPAYMVATHISQIFDGGEALVKALSAMLGE